MGTFNAGAIEAELTLDRTPFQKSLDAARAQAKRFEAKPISPKLKIDTGKEFAQLKAELEKMDKNKISIGVDLDGGDVEAHLAAIQALVEAADEKITIEVDVDTASAMAELEAMQVLVDLLDGQDIDVQVDVDAAGAAAEIAAIAAEAEVLDNTDIDIPVNAHGGALEHFSRMQAIVSAVLILLPLVPPVAAVATGVVVGLAAAVAGAMGALLAVGAAVAPTLIGMQELNTEIQKQQIRLAGMKPGTKEYIKQSEKISTLQKQLKEDFGAASEGLGILTDAWGTFQDGIRPEANELIGQVFRTIATLMPTVSQVAEAALPVLTGIFKSIGDFVNSNEGQRMTTFFREFGVDAMGKILSIGGNVIVFLGRLFEAFAPFAENLLDGILQVTAAWADWANNLGATQGFQDFIDYVNTEGPKVWDLITSIVGAFINLGVALAPLGSVWLDAFTGLFDFIAQMDPSILGAIVVALGTVTTGLLAMAAATAIWNALLAANPIGLIVIAVMALVGAIVYLWNTNEGFRDAIIGIWNAIYAAVETVVRWFTDVAGPAVVAAWNAVWQFFEGIVQWFSGTFGPAFQAIWDGIVAGVTWLWTQISPIVMGIVDVFKLAGELIGEIWSFMWERLMLVFNVFATPFRALWEALSSGATNIWNSFSGNMQRITSVLGTILISIWNNVKNVLTPIFNVIKTVAMGIFNGMKAGLEFIFKAMLAIVTFVWNTIKTVILTVIGVIKGILTAALAFMRGDVQGGMSAIRGIFTTVWNGIKSTIGAVIGAIVSFAATKWASMRQTVSTIFSSIASNISQKIESAKTFVRNGVASIIGFFANAPGALRNAGAAIIQGLIDGIREKFQQALDIARNLLGNLRDLLPFSPAKKGPFSGKGWTRFSGRAIVTDLGRGMADRADALARTAAGVIEKAKPPEMDLQFGARYAGTGGGGLASLMQGGLATKHIEVKQYIYNPVAEKTSETTTKEVSKLGALGVFE